MVPAARRRRAGVGAAERWMADGQVPVGSVDDGSRAGREPDHFDHRDAAIRAEKRELVDRPDGRSPTRPA